MLRAQISNITIKEKDIEHSILSQTMAPIYSSDLKTQVDEGQKKWTSGPDITNKVDVNEYIKFKLVEYEYFDAKDYDLWETFREDFAELKEEALKTAINL